MYSNMKYLLVVFAMVLASCANDTGANAEYDDDNIRSSSSYWWMGYSSSKANEVAKHYFPTDLVYVGISKTSNGANLVMKNNTSYSMDVSINYSVSCVVNGKSDGEVTKTILFSFDPYEQKESSSSIDGHWHGGMKTIECTGTIMSIVPKYYDQSNFQAWTGNYPISTK